VYLKRIETPHANITWRFRSEQAGFFGTQLLITPHGLDFEYLATGGKLKMALLPDLDLRRAHLLITKTLRRFTISIWHQIRAAAKTFTRRRTPASARIRASI
jgi:hypothetical protein